MQHIPAGHAGGEKAAGRAHREAFGFVAPATGVYGLASLHHPDLVVEIEATALLGE